MAGAMSAQSLITIDQSEQVPQPLLKRFGTTLPSTVGFSTLKKHQADLDALQLPYLRIFSGFNEEKANYLYDKQQVSTDGTIDFTRADTIADIVSTSGAIPYYVVTFPKGWTYTKGSSDNGDPWNQKDTKDQPKYEKLFRDFSSHIKLKYKYIPEWEILPISDYEFQPDWHQNHAFMSIYGAASKGVQQGCGSVAVPAATFPPATYNFINHDFWLYALLGEAGDAGGRVDGQTVKYQGFQAFQDGCNWGDGFRYQWWSMQLQSVVSEYSANGFRSTKSYDASAVIDFLKVAKLCLSYSDVTKIFIGQLADGRDGSRGLITRTDVKTPLYWALYLYNRMPLDRLKTQGGGTVEYMASGNDKQSAIVLWNTTSQPKSVKLRFTNLPFSHAKAHKYTIDDTHSADGELDEEDLGTVDSTYYSPTIQLAGNQTVYVFLDADETQQTEQAEPLEGYKHHMARWWNKFSEPDSWNMWDYKSSTAYVGMKSEGGVTTVGADYYDVPDSILVKGSLFGQKMGKVDDNSALYIRVDFGTGRGYSASYTRPTVFYDPVHGQYYSNHGSMPDNSFTYGGDREVYRARVDFTSPDGFYLNLKRFAPSNWNHNVRIMVYLQNPKTPQGMIAKFQFLEPKSISTGINNINASNDFKYNDGTIDSNEEVKSIQLFDITGRAVETTTGNNANLSSLPKGIYVVKVTNKNGKTTTKKIIKR